MTSSLLSLQPFAKMKITSFSFTDESRPNLCLPLCCLVQYHPSLQKRAHWKTSPVKIGVPIRLCELKQGFKDYRHLSVPSELWAANLQFFCLTPLSRQYRYNRRINHCFEVSKCRFHRQRLQSVKYLICEMKRIPSWLKHYKQSKRCPSRGTNC